jgi:DNA polymerase III delta subunit
MNKITVLFPGGFKPLTGAHMALAERYAELPTVSRVILLIGEKPRDGITREKTIEIFNLLNSNPKIEIQPTAFNSPIMAAYEFLFELPEDSVGDYAMAASTKGDDYVRTKDFVPNVDKYRMIGDKKGRTIPNGVNATELSVDVDPLLYSNGNPISASTIRQALADNDYDTFRMSYPENTDAEVKNIWQILRGTQESMFSANWWKGALSEDVEEVIEAIMNPKEKLQHTAKIKKLRSFLDNNQDKSFVYDFDKFTKTVYGAKLTEGIISENYITREELSTIESVVDGFFKQYNIDVNFQGQFTHFLERLNDPRNEAPIYMDEIKDFFEDLATEYGDKIARQLRLERPSGVGSDYQFDVPIHMPFMLQWNPGKKMIELIPRTIKKQRDRWKSNNPDDIIYKIESATPNGELITEGGAAGHMAHPWDDHGLSFNDMKEIVARALTGRLDIETAVTEKTDGQNIQITWKNGEIGFARGIGTIINPMTTPEIIADFHRKQQKAIAEKGAAAGENYQRVVDAYQACAEDLTESLKSIPEATLNDIFKNGTVFANMEIIYPATKNVIAYDKAHLQFHNLVEYDANGKAVQTDLTGGAMMQKIIQDANAHMQKTFSFIPPQRIKLGRVYDFEDQQAAFFNEINQLQRKFNLKDTDLISEYHKAWWRDVIQTKAKQMGYEIPEDVLNTLMYRWAFNNKSTNISILKKQIDNLGFLNWVAEFDKKDFKGFQKENLEPFETIFLRLGVLVLQNATNYLAANPDTTVQDIKSELTQLIRDLQTKGDPAVLKQLETQLKRIQKLGGFDAIVPTEGIVFTFQGNTYKMTGAFAPINQILGTLKYAR